MSFQQSVHDLIFSPLLFVYSILQRFLDILFSPTPPPPHATIGKRKLAVIGAGLTGVSAASHAIGHGFEVTIFEAGDENAVGGIWTKVNSSSGLQIHSLMYRFQPSIKWSESYPKRKEITDEIVRLWKRYRLDERTKFNCEVTQVYQDEQARWIINNPSHGRFDGVIAAVGSCGDPKVPHIPGQERFRGRIVHSSQLDGIDVEGKKVIVVGGGASAVEALEFVDRGKAQETSILARSEKWVIPRNVFVDALLSMNILGRETALSWIPENLLRIFFYRDLKDIAPPRSSNTGLYTETPMVNDRILDLIRSGKARWLRGDIDSVDTTGIVFNHRAQGTDKGSVGQKKLVEGDIIIMATGFKRPSLSFLPSSYFEEPYAPPFWYLQTFPIGTSTVSAINCTYVNAIGTVGNWHIGIYTRLLLVFIIDPLTRPPTRFMKAWVDFTRWVKGRAPGGTLEFFTYGELLYWFIFVVLFNPFRWKWALFVLCGVFGELPAQIVKQEEKLRYSPDHPQTPGGGKLNGST